MRFYACFVCCRRHVEPQGFTLVQEIACTQPATGANYEDEQGISSQEGAERTQPLFVFKEKKIEKKRTHEY